jgi:hypothetical protein
VVGDREEVVIVVAIPVANEFGEVVAVGPERMGVEVAFVPTGSVRIVVGAGRKNQQQSQQIRNTVHACILTIG